MGECDVTGCSGDSSIANSCSYCGNSYCSKHRLPEKHDCFGMAASNTLGPDFRGELDLTGSTPDEQTSSDTAERAECERCSNYTTSDHDLCLECRRKEQTISSRSPDMSSDGSLESNEEGREEDSDQSNSEGFFSTLKSIFGR